MISKCYDCGGTGVVMNDYGYDTECGGCRATGVPDRTPKSLSDQIGREVVLGEWDGSVSSGVLLEADFSLDCCTVQFTDGLRQRMSLTHLNEILL